MKERKKCKWELCSKIPASHATSGYCRHHQQRVANIKRRKRLIEEHICVCCGKRKAARVVCPHCEGTVKHKIRCELCEERQRISNRKHQAKEI